MQTLQRALLLQKLYLLKSIGFDYCNLQFQKPLQTQFPSQSPKNLNQIIKECQLCPQKLSPPHTGLCNPRSKLLFLTMMPILDLQMRFVSKGALMLKKIIENVFALQLQEVSILSLLKCEIPKNTQDKLLKWNGLKLFPTFSLTQLLRQPEFKIQAHKEFLTLKKDFYENN